MSIQVDIADRLYDYTDEEKAAEALAQYQETSGLQDAEIIGIWCDDSDPRRTILERMIFDAVDANGSAKRAEENIPAGITLAVAETV